MDIQSFIEIEKKYNLLDASIEGYYFWIYIRTGVAWEFEKAQQGLGEAHREKKENISKKIKLIFEKTKNILRFGRLPNQQYDVLVLNHPRRVLVDNLYECIYTDSIVEKINSTITLEESYQNMHYRPAKTSNLIYTDIIDWKSYLYCVLQRYFHRKKYNQNKKYMLQKITKPLEELNKIYGVSISAEKFGDMLICGLYMHKVELEYYRKAIQMIKPKVILEVVSYSRKCMVVNEIANEKEIPTIEIQHGTIGAEHIAYNYPKNSIVKQFPDYIFLYSKYWKDKARFPIKRDNLIAVGYPYLDRMVAKYSYRRKEKRGEKNILFLSSGPIGKKLADIAVQLEKIFVYENFHIIFKLHPGEYVDWRETYPNLQGTKIEVIDDNRTNLYELFSISDIQIGGYNSTTIFEGLSFYLDTYILNYCVSKEIKDLCADGIASYFEDAMDLAEQIKKNKEKYEQKKVEFWEKDSMSKVINQMNRIKRNDTFMEK